MDSTGTLEHLDPHNLQVDTNIRTTATIDKAFVDSIRHNGVLTPVLAWRDHDGVVHVRAGQRRTLAAREAGTATVPVYIVDAGDGDAVRLVEQMVENEQRDALTDTDRVQAWKQMELAGLTVTAIARQTGANRDTIKTGLTVAASDTGTTLVAEHGLTLDQAAVLLEFDDDPDTVTTLTEYATDQPAYFPVAVERARQDRVARHARETVEQAEAAKGHRILDERPGWNSTPNRLRMLTTTGGATVTAEDVQGKEGVSVHVVTYYGGRAEPEYYVDDPAALGFTVAEDVQVTQAQSGPMTDEQKTERKQLIANNKEWDAAEVVRREWLTTLLSRKTLPKHTQSAIATLLVTGRLLLAHTLGHGNTLAHTLLGIQSTRRDELGEYLTAHPARATHVTLAIVLAGIEQNTSRDTWRTPRPDTAAYFRALEAWGYPLTDVERRAALLDQD